MYDRSSALGRLKRFTKETIDVECRPITSMVASMEIFPRHPFSFPFPASRTAKTAASPKALDSSPLGLTLKLRAEALGTPSLTISVWDSVLFWTLVSDAHLGCPML